MIINPPKSESVQRNFWGKTFLNSFIKVVSKGEIVPLSKRAYTSQQNDEI